jgi:glycerate kinase
MLEALLAGARKIIVGLGGSATTDGGAGMAQALGAAMRSAPTPITASSLLELSSVDASACRARFTDIEVIAASDVDNPLSGAQGAAHVYGPQKGASSAEVAMLDAALHHWAKLNDDAGLEPGDGAAGGLGYGLRVLTGAKRVRGIDLVLDAVRFDERLRDCDLVLTGEGKLDAQSARGKVIAGVVERCAARKVPVVALVGAVGDGADGLREHGLHATFALCDGQVTEADAMRRAPLLLEALAERVVRWFIED